jgi:hypothetical protein
VRTSPARVKHRRTPSSAMATTLGYASSRSGGTKPCASSQSRGSSPKLSMSSAGR